MLDAFIIWKIGQDKIKKENEGGVQPSIEVDHGDNEPYRRPDVPSGTNEEHTDNIIEDISGCFGIEVRATIAQ